LPVKIIYSKLDDLAEIHWMIWRFFIVEFGGKRKKNETNHKNAER
jgi:hypothetical protein